MKQTWIFLAAAVAYGGFELWRVQFGTDYLIDADSAYHIGATQVLKERGFARTFEWAQLSVWKDTYADKEFLFHVLMIPFCSDDVDSSVRASKWFILLMGVGLFAAFAYVLRSVPGPWVWVLALVVASFFWLLRISMVRPQVIAIALVLLAVHWMLTDRWKWVAGLAVVFAWVYSAAWVVIPIGLVLLACRRFMEGEWRWKPVAAAAAGWLAGMIVNPYFPNNLALFWVHSPMVILNAWGISESVGIAPTLELQSLPSRQFLSQAPLSMALFIASNLAVAFYRERIQRDTLYVFVLAWAFFITALLSHKLIEYSVPLGVWAAALVYRDVVPVPPKPWAIVGAVLVLFASNIYVDQNARALAPSHKPYEAGASRWIQDHVPAGETILHIEFDQFGPLFMRDRTHRYLMAMDPMYSHVAYPEPTRYLMDIVAGKPPSAPEMAERLKGRYLMLRKIRAIQVMGLQMSKAKVVYQDDDMLVFDLKP